jgi:hypothetical protein
MTDKTDKPEVKVVFAEVRRPRDARDPGAAVEGRYITADGVVTLTDQAGDPVRDEHGKLYKHTLAPNDNPHAVAAGLTKSFRLRLRGKDGGRVAGFETGPLRYPKIVTI